MKRFLLSLALIALFSSGIAAQTNAGHFEIGVGYAPFFLGTVEDSYQYSYKAGGYFEWRHDLGKHLDVGAKLDYKFCPASFYDRYGGYNYKGDLHYGALLAVADFNFQPLEKASFFFGLGLGPGMILENWTSYQEVSPREGWKPEQGLGSPSFQLVVTPRVGMELFNHLRLSASVDVFVERWPVSFNIGWTF